MCEADVDRKGAIPFGSFGPGLFMLYPSILSISLFQGNIKVRMSPALAAKNI